MNTFTYESKCYDNIIDDLELREETADQNKEWMNFYLSSKTRIKLMEILNNVKLITSNIKVSEEKLDESYEITISIEDRYTKDTLKLLHDSNFILL